MQSIPQPKIREPISPIEFTIYVLLFSVGLLGSICTYALVASMCTGTSMGGNQILRLCQDYALIYPVALDFILFVGLLGLFRVTTFRPNSRILIVIGVVVMILVLSPAIWQSPFFLTPVR